MPHLLQAGREVALAHTGRHETAALEGLEHLYGERAELLAPGGRAESWHAEVLIDTFAGAKARELAALAEHSSARQVVAVSSIDVYRHCADAGVNDHPAAELAHDALPLIEDAPMRDETNGNHDNLAMEASLGGTHHVTILRPGAIYGPHANDRVLREWYLVGRVAGGERRLPLPNGGTQLFHRVALDRVARAVAAAVDRAPDRRFPVNVADPRDSRPGHRRADRLAVGEPRRAAAAAPVPAGAPRTICWSLGGVIAPFSRQSIPSGGAGTPAPRPHQPGKACPRPGLKPLESII